MAFTSMCDAMCGASSARLPARSPQRRSSDSSATWVPYQMLMRTVCPLAMGRRGMTSPLRGGVACAAMTFGVGALRGAGVVDHRLTRRHLVNEFKRGRLSRLDVCDAHPELVRAARSIGHRLDLRCPVCGDPDLRVVTYVYGAKLMGNRLLMFFGRLLVSISGLFDACSTMLAKLSIIR